MSASPDPPRRRGLFLDMDGTLADSMAVMRIVHARFLAEHGVAATDADFERVNGIPLRVGIETMRSMHAIQGESRVLVHRFVELIAETYEEVPPMAGALELVLEARSRGMALALVTSAAEGFARDWLARARLAPHFAVVVGGDSVERGKPHPDPYLRALELSRCDAAQSIAVEDSRPGARAAVDAGLATYVLGSGEGTGWPDVAGFVGTLVDVPLDLERARR